MRCKYTARGASLSCSAPPLNRRRRCRACRHPHAAERSRAVGLPPAGNAQWCKTGSGRMCFQHTAGVCCRMHVSRMLLGSGLRPAASSCCTPARMACYRMGGQERKGTEERELRKHSSCGTRSAGGMKYRGERKAGRENWGLSSTAWPRTRCSAVHAPGSTQAAAMHGDTMPLHRAGKGC